MSIRSLVLRLFGVLRFLVNVAGVVIGLAYLVLFAATLLHAQRIETLPAVREANHFLLSSIRATASWLPAAGRPYAALILAVAAWIVKSIVDGLLVQAEIFVRRSWKPAPAATSKARANATADRYSLSAETERDRETLLRRYRDIEEALKSSARKSCTFLSIDVVGSTTMKQGERATSIAATFQAYEDMVRHIMAEYSVWKDTWTPDGVMACFLDTNLAVGAGQNILRALETFNARDNQLRTPIKVRAGLNEGEVSIFEDTSLEKVADHAIDVAGHMQKHAGEDALQISDEVYARLKDQSGFAATGRNVDGYPTYEWTPNQSASTPAPS